MNLPKASDLRSLVILFAVTILMVVLYGQIDYTVEPFATWDLSTYRNMALVSPEINPDLPKPFAYRVLGPYLVGLLPIPDAMGFYAFSVAFSICLVFQFYYLLRYMRLPAAISAVTVMFFIFNKYLFGFTVWDYFQLNDLLSLNLIIVMFLSIWKNQWIVFGITLVLGAITREASMLMIPVVFAYLLEQKELSTKWPKAVAAIIPGLVAFFLIRVLIPTTGGNSLLEAFRIFSHKLYSFKHILRLLVNSFLPFSFIPLIFFKHTLQFFRKKKYMLLFVGLVFFSTMFGSNNERLMAPSFIVFYALYGAIIRELNPKKTILLFLIAAGVLSSFHHVSGKWPLPTINWTYFLTLGATLVVTVYMGLLRLRLHMQHRECENGCT